MKFKKGAVGEAFLSETIGSPAFIRFEFYGTEGTILMDSAWEQPIKFFSSKGDNPSFEWETPEVEHLPMPQFYSLSFREEVKEFVDSILNNREPKYRGEEGKVAVEMALMGTLSARTGRVVKRSDLRTPLARRMGIK
jgi:predicted dehydrogenase